MYLYMYMMYLKYDSEVKVPTRRNVYTHSLWTPLNNNKRSTASVHGYVIKMLMWLGNGNENNLVNVHVPVKWKHS